MQDTNLIASDLRMCLMEGKRKFDFLNFYRGVQFVSQAELESVLETQAKFKMLTPSSVLLDRDKTSIVLSNGLMDPFMIRVEMFDIQTGVLVVTDMAYAGDTVGNRHEHRIEVEPVLPLDVEMDRLRITGELVDISLSGAGVHLPMTVNEAELRRGRNIWLMLHLPEGEIRLAGEILRFRRTFSNYWVAVKFVGEGAGNAGGKTAILHYINRRLGEIRNEVQGMYTAACQAKIPT